LARPDFRVPLGCGGVLPGAAREKAGGAEAATRLRRMAAEFRRLAAIAALGSMMAAVAPQLANDLDQMAKEIEHTRQR